MEGDGLIFVTRWPAGHRLSGRWLPVGSVVVRRGLPGPPLQSTTGTYFSVPKDVDTGFSRLMRVTRLNDG